MTHHDILQTAMQQSAEDMGCSADDFLADHPVLVPFRMGSGARRYLKEPMTAHLVSYGHNIVAGVAPDVQEEISAYIQREDFYHCFETPSLYALNRCLEKKGYTTCFMAEYYLPSPAGIPSLTCPVEARLLYQEDFQSLYLPEWSNALCEDRKELDVLGVGAYEDGHLVGLAACSRDCEEMWQIGIDVLPAYRHLGIASSLTARLAREILNRGKVPFYCSAWSNLPSVRNAIRSGFLPSWVELTVKPVSVVQDFNKEQLLMQDPE